MSLSKNKKYRIFHLKITIFTALKYYSMLHGDVCVMPMPEFTQKHQRCEIIRFFFLF